MNNIKNPECISYINTIPLIYYHNDNITIMMKSIEEETEALINACDPKLRIGTVPATPGQLKRYDGMCKCHTVLYAYISESGYLLTYPKSKDQGVLKPTLMTTHYVSDLRQCPCLFNMIELLSSGALSYRAFTFLILHQQRFLLKPYIKTSMNELMQRYAIRVSFAKKWQIHPKAKADWLSLPNYRNEYCIKIKKILPATYFWSSWWI